MSNVPFNDDGEMVCHCFGISAYEIKCAVYEKGLNTVEEVTAEVRAGGGCQSCHWRILEIIDEIHALRESN